MTTPGNPTISQDAYKTAHSSYGRCCIRPTFFNDFYKRFTTGSAEVGRMFKNTDMNKQKQLLKSGISLMLMYAKGHPTAESALQRIAIIHDKNHINVKPELYKYWVDCVLDTIKEHDKKYTPEVERAWKKVFSQGINFFISKY